MLNEQKIIFVCLVDNNCMSFKDHTVRIWDYEKLVKKFLEEETCIIGRKTYDLTQWKGKKSWVLTGDRNWRKTGIGTIHSFDDLHLFTEDGPIYIIGGSSLFLQMEEYADEIHLYIINNNKGNENWVDIDMRDWKPTSYKYNNIWSYSHMYKLKNSDPHRLNLEFFE